MSCDRGHKAELGLGGRPSGSSASLGSAVCATLYSRMVRVRQCERSRGDTRALRGEARSGPLSPRAVYSAPPSMRVRLFTHHSARGRCYAAPPIAS